MQYDAAPGVRLSVRGGVSAPRVGRVKNPSQSMELQMLNLKVLVCGLAVSSVSLVAVAQPTDKPAPKQPDSKPGQPGERAPRGGGDRARGGGPGGMLGEQLSAEKAKAAWDLEATGVASRLGLNADQTKALVKAYEDARTSHR